MILAVCPKGFPGVTTFFKSLDHNLPGQVKYSSAEEFNITLIEQFDVKQIFVSAWSDSYIKILESIKKLNKGIKIYISWHSPSLQTELSNEKPKLDHIIKLYKNNQISGLVFLDLRFYNYFKSVLQNNIFFLPDFFNAEECLEHLTEHLDSKTNTQISLFGPNHHRKNNLTQFAIMSEILKLNPGFYGATNLPIEPYSFILRQEIVPRIKVLPWLERSVYVKEVPVKSRLGLCLTCSESYNFNLWEYLLSDVPVLTSADQLSYLETRTMTICESRNGRKLWDQLSKGIIQCDLNDPLDGVESFQTILKFPAKRDLIRLAALRINEETKRFASNTLASIANKEY